MGCDIHIYTERLTDGKWQSLDKWKTEDGYIQVDGCEVFEGRNYNLFAMLADVRNRRGFAGIKTGEGFIPICDPKGFPSNASNELKALNKQWEGDGHSHSYLTLAELLRYDWTQTTTLRGTVEGYEFAEMMQQQRDRPESWSGSVSGGSVIHCSKEQIEAIVCSTLAGRRFWDCEHDLKKALLHHYVEHSWQVRYSETAGAYWWQHTIADLLHLSGGDFNSVRLVFWFDN